MPKSCHHLRKCQKGVKLGIRNPIGQRSQVSDQKSDISVPPRREKAANDPAAAGVPDPLGSEVFVIQKLMLRPR